MADKEAPKQVDAEEPRSELKPEGPVMPNKEAIEAFKDKYGALEMRYIGGDGFIFRRLTTTEHQLMNNDPDFANQTPEDARVELIKRLLVWPKYDSYDWDKGAGVAITLEDCMLQFSGFVASSPIKL
jgi:hypothetical protein